MTVNRRTRRALSRSLPRVLAATAVAGSLALAGCSSGGTPSSTSGSGDFDGVELTVWNNIDYDPYQSLQEKYFADCATELGITVKNETITGDYTSKLLQAASSKSLPDIALLSTDVQVPLLASQGVLADLDSLGVSTDGLEDSVAALGQYEDTLYALPVQVEDYAVFYNKDLFAAAGITEAPTTFDELVEDAKALTTADQYGVAFAGNATDGAAPVFFLPFLLSAGGDPADPTSDGAVAAVDLYKKLFDDGSLSKEFVNWGWDANDQWTGGKAAIAVTGPWQLVTPTDFEYGIAPFPTLEAGEEPKVGLLGYAYGVAAQSDETKAQAAAALVECRASEENQVETAVQGGYIPALTTAQEAFVAEVPGAAPFVDAVPTAVNTATLGTDWNTLQQQYVTAIQDATVNGTSAEEALSKAVAGQ
ncbi:extracellular solute-binding protein [Herbiconiux moechotypicola]|uniref:Sugar ABC transporter substrate-binding protein n=1 Tax=Herbiconiux moechotypicola TaxID=637393 RepID=A0ABN3D8T4_9MICO|nr:extracellular solute-binding protein [Herbiconiux moechotypicola]MCS5728184.1 extracellular solute-binding protein [Herbiconiux moechotypicola]